MWNGGKQIILLAVEHMVVAFDMADVVDDDQDTVFGVPVRGP